ncbi:MAG: phosphoglycerate mutase [Rhodospirillaceae bacterium]|nr:phosphoglycerate mutase [Rhodospirillaceae bacterium]|tara:strand:- start:2927 stop:3535 length:609 start_codon:yes stop_codon:yes gene_type:complete
MSTLFAIIRHAPTPWNVDGKIQGRSDISLSPHSKRAMAECCLPKCLEKAVWFTSPLKRALETARLLGLEETYIEPRLIEMNWGKWEGEKLKNLRLTLGSKMKTNEDQGLDFMPPGGESPRHVQHRVKSLLLEISKETPNKIVGAISHKGVIRSLLSLATGWDMLGQPPIKMDWSKIQIFSIDANGIPRPYRYNVPLKKSGKA